jgi:hypothetical protein
MPFNVLLLPLLGGYVFITHWNRTRYATRRHSGERLLFHAALAGSFFLTFGYLATRLLIRLLPELGMWWRGLVPFPYSGSALIAFLTAVAAPSMLNRMRRFESKAEAMRAMKAAGDHLEEVLPRSARRAMPVSVTLKTRKVYVGFVTGIVDPTINRQHIGLLPLRSGYREETDLRLVLNTDYTAVYGKIIHTFSSSVPDLDENMKDFIIVFPVAEVQSVNIFDNEAYRVFQETSQPPADAMDSAA